MEDVIIIGGGPAGLMAAQVLAERGFSVTVCEQKVAPARKFLVAGHGGFNLTHSMPYETMLSEYTPPHVVRYIRDFTSKDTVDWLQRIGIATYTGSSGKVFPAGNIKPVQVLQAWLRYLGQLGVTIRYRHELLDFDAAALKLQHKDQAFEIPYRKAIFALGGASWPQTGATGSWVPLLQEKDIPIEPLVPANSGLDTSDDYSGMAGCVLKNIALRAGSVSRKGELVFTDYGLEGSPVYYLNRELRRSGLPAAIYIDLKPQLEADSLLQVLQQGHRHITDTLKKHLNIQGTALQLLKRLPKQVFTDPEQLVRHIKNYPVTVTAFRPLGEAISTAGGLSWEALNDDLGLKGYGNIHCIGEMLDWDAPTGGFLLQACFAMGHYIGSSLPLPADRG